MKRMLCYGCLIFAADYFLPTVETGAQVAIAPLIVALIPAIAGLIGSSMQANAKGSAAVAQASGAAAQKQKGKGVSIKPTIGSVDGKSVPPSKHSEAVKSADLAQTKTPLFGEGGEEAAKRNLAKKGDKKGDKKTTMDDKLQMAAIAAQLGGALAQGGQAPPPPGLPHGGGMGMQPVFQNTARDLFGG